MLLQNQFKKMIDLIDNKRYKNCRRFKKRSHQRSRVNRRRKRRKRIDFNDYQINLNSKFIESVVIALFIYYLMSENKTSNLKNFVPKPYKKRRYYIKSELTQHCSPNDVWVSFFGDIYDLTNLIQQHR